jgi:trehalose 6-phosphate synthase
MPRIVVVSNRVAPITEGQPTSGGLAAGVLDALRASGGIWFGWSGEITQGASGEPAASRQAGPIAIHTIKLSQADYDGYYRGFANGTLWPTLHYQIGLAEFSWADYAAWKRVNRVFARSLASLLRPGDLIWAQDYHLFGLAEALREIGVTNRVGLFVHTPFPPPSVFMTIPPHAEVANAMAAYDLIGFQTETDRVAYDDYLVRQAGGRVVDRFVTKLADRTARTEIYPIGVDTREIAAQAADPANRFPADELRASLGSCNLILSVDRLDYSKGLRQRFLSYEKFLEGGSHRGEVSFLQIAPPSREDIDTYREIRHELEGEAGRINGRFADLGWVPLRYLNRAFSRSALMPIYRLARIGLVTPIRDGMNLVAKEYAAAQDPSNPGVLILSQFAGAAQELTSALIVNPYDQAGMAQAIQQGLNMTLGERIERHRDMLLMLERNSLARWRDRFVADLAASG